MKQELMRLGLTGNETSVYVVLLELGSTNAGEIIKRTKLHRNIVYENLDKLISKGLVGFVIVKNVKQFETAPLNELKVFIGKQKKEVLDREKIVNEILPQLEKKRVEIKQKQEASVFKGKKGLKNILEDIVNIKKEVMVFGTGWGMKEIMGDYYEQWHLKLRQKKAKARILLPNDKKGEFLKPFIARYLSEKKIMPSTIAVYGDKVLNIIWGEEPVAILITSEKASNSYKKYFEMLWGIARR